MLAIVFVKKDYSVPYVVNLTNKKTDRVPHLSDVVNLFNKTNDIMPGLKRDNHSSSSSFLPSGSGFKAINVAQSTLGENDLRILFWTPWLRTQMWWYMPHTSLVTCGDVTCQFTHDKSLHDQSDALLFYFYHGFINNRNPDAFPKKRIADQYWTAYFDSAPPFLKMEHMGKVDNVFNLTATHHHRADIHLPFGICEKVPGAEHVEADYATGKKGLVSWIVSHCNTYNGRENYVQELQKYLNVTVRGQCSQLGAEGGLCDSNLPDVNLCEDAVTTMNSYKFYLAFENSNCVDYISEKVYKVLKQGMATVPVILSGVTNLKDILPPNSFIDAASFASPKELAAYLMMLDGDDTQYNGYFTWRSSYTCDLSWRPRLMCCGLAELRGQKKVVSDISSVYGKNNCEKQAPTYKGLDRILGEYALDSSTVHTGLLKYISPS